jgi:glycosyltransferase involved in cell wall biosynthesis
MAFPKISVCIPVRNGGVFLPLAVESVLAQSFSSLELIVSDNCSTDGTAEWVKKAAAQTPNIRFFSQNSDVGMVRNFNACLAEATGEYVKFLCAEDLLLPGSLQRMAEALDADPSVVLVAGGRRLINEVGERIGTRRYAKKDVKVSGVKAINRCLFAANYIGEPSAVMFRRQAAQRGFSESLPQLMDLEMWFHLLEQGAFVSLADEVCAVRHHQDQMTMQNIRTGALIDDNLNLFESYEKKSYIEESYLNSAVRRARLAYRVWLCRDEINSEKRNKILKAHSSTLIYQVMPILTKVLFAWRALEAITRSRKA